MSNFLERFKGKTQQVGKEGVFDLIRDTGINGAQNVVVKTNINFKPNSNIETNKTKIPHQQSLETKYNKYQQEPQLNIKNSNSQQQSSTSNSKNLKVSEQKIEPKKNNGPHHNNPFYVANPFKMDDEEDDQPYTPQIKEEKQSPKLKQINNDNKKNLETKNTLKYARQSSLDAKKTKQWVKLGGLGANIGGQQWQQKKKKLQKMQEFADQVKAANNQKLKQRKNEPEKKQREKEKEKNPRQKALEYCKNIPKPPKKLQKKQQTPTLDPLEQKPEEKLTQLQIYERRHQELQKLLNNKN